MRSIAILGFYFVVWMLVRTLYHFHESKNPVPGKIIHGTTIGIAWTIAPSLVLVSIALPSFALLYSIDEVIDPSVTIKAIAHQWYGIGRMSTQITVFRMNLP